VSDRPTDVSATEPEGAVAGKTGVVVMGVSGSGKTTVAELMAARLGWQLAEADDFHPPANKKKMAAGIPLTDDDRQPWLRALRDFIDASPRSTVITCSALKRSYRDLLRSAHADVEFLHLHGDPELIRRRMATRRGHFMPTSLLESQLATLEPLQPGEPGVVVDISQPPERIVELAIRELGLHPTVQS
jgi:gluconokinase